jgi:hypothetical protein
VQLSVQFHQLCCLWLLLLWRLKHKGEVATDNTADEIAQKAAQTKAGVATDYTADAIKQKAALAKEGIATDYTADEIAEVLFFDSEIWVQCKIVGHSAQPNHYKIEIDPGVHQDAYFYEGQTPDVSVRNLRKLEVEKDL